MTTEAFVSKKEIINASVIKKNELIEKLETRLTALTTGKSASEEAFTKLYVFRDLEKLDRYSVDSLIDGYLFTAIKILKSYGMTALVKWFYVQGCCKSKKLQQL